MSPKTPSPVADPVAELLLPLGAGFGDKGQLQSLELAVADAMNEGAHAKRAAATATREGRGAEARRFKAQVEDADRRAAENQVARDAVGAELKAFITSEQTRRGTLRTSLQLATLARMQAPLETLLADLDRLRVLEALLQRDDLPGGGAFTGAGGLLQSAIQTFLANVVIPQLHPAATNGHRERVGVRLVRALHDEAAFARVAAAAKLSVKRHHQILQSGLLREVAQHNVNETAYLSPEAAAVVCDVLHAGERINGGTTS